MQVMKILQENGYSILVVRFTRVPTEVGFIHLKRLIKAMSNGQQHYVFYRWSGNSEDSNV